VEDYRGPSALQPFPLGRGLEPTPAPGLGQDAGQLDAAPETVEQYPRGCRPATCPITALAAWLDQLDAEAGPIFRAVDRLGRIRATRLGDRHVARIVKRAAARADLDPRRYAGRSLRAGLATSAAIAGVEERTIMAQTRHHSVAEPRRLDEGRRELRILGEWAALQGRRLGSTARSLNNPRHYLVPVVPVTGGSDDPTALATSGVAYA
jgi:hypothetical protein